MSVFPTPSAFPTPSQTLDFFAQAAPPLSVETFETIMGRIIADTNAGIEPTSPEYLDVTVGSLPHDLYGGLVMEFDRIYDFAANEVVRAGIPTLAEGPYLDSWAESLGLERKNQAASSGTVTFTGTPGTIVNVGVQVATQAISSEVPPIVFATTAGGTIGAGGTLALPVMAQAPGAQGNVLANTITVLVSNVTPPEGSTTSITSVTNGEAMSGGANVETDAELQERVGLALAGTNGAGTQDDYVRWFLGEPGVGHVTVQAAWSGPNTVRVILTDVNNNPFATPFLEKLQKEWDPNANGDGSAKGPIGHIITIATPTAEGVTIVAKATMEAGFTYKGIGGTRATEPSIIAALRAYVGSLVAGGNVVLYKSAAAIMDVEGVANLSGLQIGDATTTPSSAYTSGETTLKVTSAAGAVEGGNVVVIGGGNIAVATITKIVGTTLTIASLGHNFATSAQVIFTKAEDLTISGVHVASLSNVVLL